MSDGDEVVVRSDATLCLMMSCARNVPTCCRTHSRSTDQRNLGASRHVDA